MEILDHQIEAHVQWTKRVPGLGSVVICVDIMIGDKEYGYVSCDANTNPYGLVWSAVVYGAGAGGRRFESHLMAYRDAMNLALRVTMDAVLTGTAAAWPVSGKREDKRLTHQQAFESDSPPLL